MIQQIKDWQEQSSNRLNVGIKALNADVGKEVVSDKEAKQLLKSIDDYAKLALSSIKDLKDADIKLIKEADLTEIMNSHKETFQNSGKLIMQGKTLFNTEEVKKALAFDQKYTQMRGTLSSMMGPQVAMIQQMAKQQGREIMDTEKIYDQFTALYFSLTPKKKREALIKVSQNKRAKRYIEVVSKGMGKLTQEMFGKLMAKANAALEGLGK